MKTLPLVLCIISVFWYACSSPESSIDNDSTDSSNHEMDTTKEATGLDRINLPDGFTITVFAEVDNARSMAISPAGVIYVGNRSGNKVYAVKDTDGDGKADEKHEIAKGLNSPNGVAFRGGALYVAEINRILKFPNIEANLNEPGKYQVVYDKYPTEGHHGWKYIAFGPDGKLYVPVGAPCNICKSDDEIFASITRINPDGTGLEIIAEGVRNTVGFDWHPETKNLWFTDNGRDMMGDEIPPCELNRLTDKGQHFGYPYCHGNDIGDPEFGSQRHCSEFKKPVWNFKAHTAPLGMKFYTGDMFPDDYKGDVIVAQHGSWNRSSKIGYRLMRIKVDGTNVTDAEVFADGWLDEQVQEAWGRPVDVLQMPDGSLLVSDDHGGKIFRITYDGK